MHQICGRFFHAAAFCFYPFRTFCPKAHYPFVDVQLLLLQNHNQPLNGRFNQALSGHRDDFQTRFCFTLPLAGIRSALYSAFYNIGLSPSPVASHLRCGTKNSGSAREGFGPFEFQLWPAACTTTPGANFSLEKSGESGNGGNLASPFTICQIDFLTSCGVTSSMWLHVFCEGFSSHPS